MKMRHLLGCASLAALALACAPAANAGEIPLGGYSGPIQIVFNDYENFTGSGGLAVSNSNYGLLQISSILDNHSNIIYQAPIAPTASNPLIVGVFSQIHVGTVNGLTAEANTAGQFSFFADTSTAFGTLASQGTAGYTSIGCAVNTQCYNGITNMGYDNLLNFELVQGASNFDTTSYLHSNLTSLSPLVGNTQGYGHITGGSDVSQFGVNGFTTAAGLPADLFFKNSFCTSGVSPCNTAPSDWTLVSHDPVFANAIPEPSTLAIFGSALLGLAMFGHWRRKRAA